MLVFSEFSKVFAVFFLNSTEPIARNCVNNLWVTLIVRYSRLASIEAMPHASFTSVGHMANLWRLNLKK